MKSFSNIFFWRSDIFGIAKNPKLIFAPIVIILAYSCPVFFFGKENIKYFATICINYSLVWSRFEIIHPKSLVPFVCLLWYVNVCPIQFVLHCQILTVLFALYQIIETILLECELLMLPPIALPDNRVAGLCAHLGNIDDFATVDIHQWVIRFQRFVILRLALIEKFWNCVHGSIWNDSANDYISVEI